MLNKNTDMAFVMWFVAQGFKLLAGKIAVAFVSMLLWSDECNATLLVNMQSLPLTLRALLRWIEPSTHLFLLSF